MQFFQEFDPEDQKAPETPLSLTEKGMIMAIALLGKYFIRKGKRAKTYGDLYKILNVVEGKFKTLEDKFESIEEEDFTEENAQDMIKGVTGIAEALND